MSSLLATPTTTGQEHLAFILKAIKEHPDTVPASKTDDSIYDIVNEPSYGHPFESNQSFVSFTHRRKVELGETESVVEESEVFVSLELLDDANVMRATFSSQEAYTPATTCLLPVLCSEATDEMLAHAIMERIEGAHRRIVMAKYTERYTDPAHIAVIPTKERQGLTVRFNNEVAFPLYTELVSRNTIQFGNIGSTYTIVENMHINGDTMSFTFTYHDDFYPLANETETTLEVTISAKIRIGTHDVTLEIGHWSKSYALFDEETIFAEIAEEMVKDLIWATETRFFAQMLMS